MHEGSPCIHGGEAYGLEAGMVIIVTLHLAKKELGMIDGRLFVARRLLRRDLELTRKRLAESMGLSIWREVFPVGISN